MLSWIVYGVGSAIFGLLLGIAWLTFFGDPSKLDRPTGPTLIKAVVVGIAAPFVWVEGLTKAVGPQMESAARQAFAVSEIRGPMRYFRVVFVTKTTARLLVFGKEEDRGFTDSPIIAADLVLDDTKWRVKDTQVLVSDRLNKDMLVFPPYQ